jgi:hypothetical protein
MKRNAAAAAGAVVLAGLLTMSRLLAAAMRLHYLAAALDQALLLATRAAFILHLCRCA